MYDCMMCSCAAPVFNIILRVESREGAISQRVESDVSSSQSGTFDMDLD